MGVANGAAGWGFVTQCWQSSPRLPHAWLLHRAEMGSDGMGANGARFKLLLVDLQGKLFK